MTEKVAQGQGQSSALQRNHLIWVSEKLDS